MRRIMGKNNKKYSRRLLAALLLFSMLEISGCSIKETDRTAGSTKESEAVKESSTAEAISTTEAMDEWTVYRIAGEGLNRLADGGEK